MTFVNRWFDRILAVARQSAALALQLRHAWVRLLSGLAIVFLGSWVIYAGYIKWQETAAATNYCPLVPQDWQHQFRYIELYIDNEELREPIFEGRYYIDLGSDFGENHYQLRVSYQDVSRYHAPTAHVSTFSLNDNQNLTMQNNNGEEMAFVSQSSSHYMFPFDSARFHETFTFEPAFDIRAVLLRNRVAGFYMPCDTSTAHTEMGSAEVSFELRRNPLIVYTAAFLLVVAAMFAILITIFMETGPLPHALSSYFFAVWSIRALFGLTADGFPTLFDLIIVSLVLLILMLLLLRGLGLREALLPVGRYARNFVRRLEGRELLSAPAAENAET